MKYLGVPTIRVRFTLPTGEIIGLEKVMRNKSLSCIYPRTTAGEIGWKPCKIENELEKREIRNAKRRISFGHQMNWPEDTVFN